MADTKITALAPIGAIDPANDVLPIVDVSNNSMAASGTTCRVTTNQLLQANAIASLASATITGDLTVATNTLKTTSGNVGIGTVTPDIFGRFYTRNIGFNSSGTTGLQINGGTGGYGAIDLGASGVRTFAMSASAVDAQITTVTNIPLLFNINGATKMTLNTAGNLAFLSGQGIDFSATAEGGAMTSELLNDYEEGTWTIGLTFGGGNTGITASANQGKYTKIGRQVTVTGYLGLTNKGSSTGAALLTGLPFLVQNSTENYSAASLHITSIAFADFPMAYGSIGTANITLQEATNAGVRSNLTDADFSNNSEILLSFTYFV